MMKCRILAVALGLAIPATLSAALISYSGWSEPVSGFGDLPSARYITAPDGVATIVLRAEAGKTVEFVGYDLSARTGLTIAANDSILVWSTVEDLHEGELTNDQNSPVDLVSTLSSA